MLIVRRERNLLPLFFRTIRRYTTMMVILGTNTSGDQTIYPADRCTWEQETRTNGQGYSINNASFHPGNAAATTIPSPRLGYIGKSGRFVEIAN